MFSEENYYHLFQPIMNNKSGIPLGFEALLRHSSNKSPELIFKEARNHQLLVNLDLFSISLCMERQKFLINRDINIFINIYPITIASPKFNKILDDIKELKLKNLIFEINESSDDKEVWGSDMFLTNINKLKSLGVKVAIDDVGKGQSTLQNIINIEPDFIKLDRSFSKNLSITSAKQRLILSFLEISKALGSKLVLEGIETKEDFKCANQLGVSFVQGFFFGKPAALKEEQAINL